MSSFDSALLQRDFPARDGAPVSRDPGPSVLAVRGALNNHYQWSQDVEAFFSHDWAARLCVVHAPSGRVVCLGVKTSFRQAPCSPHPFLMNIFLKLERALTPGLHFATGPADD